MKSAIKVKPQAIGCYLIVLALSHILFLSPCLAQTFKEFEYGNQDRLQVGFSGSRVQVRFKPRTGEGAWQMGQRLLSNPNDFKKILQYNNNRPIMVDRAVNIPFRELNAVTQGVVLRALFVNDHAEDRGWVHQVRFKGETLGFISGVFANGQVKPHQLAHHNRLKNGGRNLKVGDEVVIPWHWLREELELMPIQVKEPLYVQRDNQGKRFAWYRLQQGEALYSSVVIRFTGRLHNEEVLLAAKELLELNRIEDPTSIQVNTALKIPLSWISEEYLLETHPHPTEAEPEPEQEAVEEAPMLADQGWHVILDAGHGGVDPGANFGSVANGDRIFEDELVYDITLRMKEKLARDGIKVYPTLEDPNQPHPVSKLSQKHDQDETLLVNPRYKIEDTNVGINLRVYLINHVYHQLRKKRVPAQNILLMSVHGDALHQSQRGASVYYADKRLRMKTFSLTQSVYRRRQEYRRHIRFDDSSNHWSAYRSRKFGETLIEGFQAASIPVIGTQPVRSFHYRHGQKTLPGILRYSRVPTSVLVEVANLNNAQDRRAMLQASNREKTATVLVESIKQHFEQSRRLSVAGR